MNTSINPDCHKVTQAAKNILAWEDSDSWTSWSRGRRSGNTAVIDYNNKDGWIRYKKVSDNYAKEISETVKQ